VTRHPVAVFGVPLYNGERHVAEALESLLSQTREDLAVVVVDDASHDRSPEVVQSYAAADARLTYVRNERRVGMVENWRRCFGEARRRHPHAGFFAWGSDHDVWHPRWLEELVNVVSRRPEVVLAYPLNLGIDEEGRTVRREWRFDSSGQADVDDRLSSVVHGMSAGNMVYGLFRSDVLARCGVYRSLLNPDRLLLAEASLYGEFIQVPQLLWHRRYRAGVKASKDRQRASFFPDGAPATAFLPWSVTHTATLVQDLALRAAGRPEIGRATGLRLAARYLTESVGYEAGRRLERTRRRAGRR
jgi:glycosyltransferase involved in cell wall biosynthesis